MGQVVVEIMGRNYKFVCGDGEEERIKTLAAYVRAKVNQLSIDQGRTSDDRLLVMAALVLADELFEARASANSTAVSPAPPARPKQSA